MEKSVDLQKNKLLYPFQLFLNGVVHLLFSFIRLISPNKYHSKIESFESNCTLSNIIGLTLFNALGGFLLMITNIKLANILGAALFGVYSYYMAIGEVGINFVRYGRDKSMTRDLIQMPNQFNSLISNTCVLSLLNLFVFVLVIVLFSRKLDIPINFASISIIIATCLISLDLQPVYESIKLMSWHSLYNIIQRLLFLVLIWVPLVIVDVVSLEYIGLILLFSWIVVLIIQYHEIISQLQIKLSDDFTINTIKQLYKSNFLIAVSCMMGVAFGPLIRMILKNFVDDTAVGLYAACFQIFLISKFILTQIARVGNPMMAEAGKEDCSKDDKKRFIIRYLEIMLIGTLPFVIPMLFFSGLITDICFTEEYFSIRKLIPYFGICLLAMSIGNVFEQFLISMRRDRIYFSIYISCAVLTIIMAIFLIPSYGVLGGVLAYVIPNVIARLLYFAFGMRLLKGFDKN